MKKQNKNSRLTPLLPLLVDERRGMEGACSLHPFSSNVCPKARFQCFNGIGGFYWEKGIMVTLGIIKIKD